MTSLGCGDFGIYVFCIIQGHQDQKLAFCNSSKNPFLYRASIKFIPKKCQFDSGDPVLFFYTTYSNRFFFKILLSHSRLIIHKRGQLIESMITYYLNILPKGHYTSYTIFILEFLVIKFHSFFVHLFSAKNFFETIKNY